MSLTCDHCGEPVVVDGWGFIHTDGFVYCHGGRCHTSATVAPRPVTVAAPTTPQRPWRVIPDNELPALG